MLLKDIYNSCNAPGNRYLKDYMEGKKLSLNQAVKAKCAECMAGFLDGKIDCGLGDCPLYPWMVYSKKKPVKPGEEKKERKKRVISKEQIEKMQEGRRNKGV
jgi:hypothetical protein